MKKILFFASLICASSIVYGDIIGEWKLDVEKTVEFNKANGNITDLWQSLLSCLAENSILTINNDHYTSIAKDHTCSHEGKSTQIDGYSINYPYTVVFNSPDKTALVINNEEGYEFIEVIHKMDDDLIWMYYPGEPKDYDSHIRHYYRRQK